MKSAFALGALTALLALLSGCVSESAGYQDVRNVVSRRTGHDVRWQHLEGDDRSQKAAREILSKPLTAESAVKLALLNSPELQASFEELGIARADLVTALALPNPVAEGAVRFHKDSRTTPTIDLSLSEDLTQLIFLPLRNGVAQADFEVAKLSVAARAMDVVLQVRQAFYGHLAASQTLEFRNTVMQALEAAATVAKSLHEAGNITDLDLANEVVLFDETRISVATAQTALSASRERLTSLLGLWGTKVSWRVDSRLGDPAADLPLTGLESTAVERSLDLAMIRHRFRAAARRANLARAEGILPELKGGVTLEREEGAWSYGPMAELEVPLFYQGQGEVARAKADMRRQKHLFAARAVQVRATARELAMRATAARDRALYLKNVLLPMRAKIVRETQLQFNAMNISVFQLLIAKRDQVESARSYVEALRDYWNVRAEVEQLRSGRLPGNSALDVATSEVGSSGARAGGH